MDQVTILRRETHMIKTDKAIFLNHGTEIAHNIKIHNIIIEVVHPNIKDKLIKYNQLKKLIQILPVLITQKTQSYINSPNLQIHRR